MEERYRKLENPQKPTRMFHAPDQKKFNFRPPQAGDIVSVTTKGKIYIQIMVESVAKESIKGEVVGIGPAAAPIVGTINQDDWKLCDKIEIDQSWIDGITYHEGK